MKLRNFIVSALAAVVAAVSCGPQEEENLGMPSIKIGENAMDFAADGGEKQLTVAATRDWMAEYDAEWLVVSPDKGSASSNEQTVTVTALANTGMDRTAEVTFTIGMSSKTLTVTQTGPGGSAEALVVYANDFDKTKAEKGSSWATYLDSFDGWMNATGTGLETVTYGFDRITARTNSGNGSAGSYSDYVALGASGMNYLWFGSGTPYFAVKNITLPEGKTDFTLSFGTERYLYEASDNTFNWDEFKVYVSADGSKWVKLSCEFAGGALPDGRWDLAQSTFSVPAGTSALYVYFVSSLGSAYALDDLKLVQAGAAGTALDFANGEEFEVGDSTTGGGNAGGGDSTTAPESKGKKTVEEFIAASDASNYYELTGTVSGFNPTYCSFDLTDATGKIYVYSVLDASKSEWSSKIANGGTVTIYGKYLYYEQKSQHEVVDAWIVSYTPGEGGDTGGDTPSGEPESLTKVTVAEFLAAPESADTWYELTGEVASIVEGNAYGNLYIKDDTGEVYIYGLTNGWVGYNDKSFDSIGINVGDVITIGTLRGSYNNEPQGGGSKVPAYFISFASEGGDNGSGDEGGQDDPDTPSEYTKVTVAEFLAAAEDDTWYELTGQIINVASDVYGNLTIKDETGEVYLYGLTKTYVTSNDKSYASIGLSLGDYVTVAVQRGSYNGNPQGVNAFYLSHEEGELDLGDNVDFTKVTSAPSDWTGTYLIMMADGKAHGSVSGKDLAAVSDVLTDNGGVISTVEAYAVKIASAGDGKWSVQLPDGKYLKCAHNSCSTSATPVALGLEYTDKGVKISGEATNKEVTNTYYLYYSTNNGEYIRFYVDKSTDNRYTLPTLYKK